ncbi:hypothetical protein K443DRAFT_127958 [Laccaria amethystina LaAM-08-1]|uniref:RING-type E3 ubiquitin transferase n=1 Tax=Laccaria amethystina LaAM-08-1 TaxID=1095629 RepID=A0A0C9YLW1_9AGAR|nr:hypothetical protein K443DRAFT_127958 [Laccaria amethystina LaAM-08-1]
MDTARDEEAGLPENARTQQPRSSVPSFLFISFLLFMLTSHNGDEFLARHQYQDALRSLSYQLSNYTAWMNGTASNFSVPLRDVTLSPLLDAFYTQGGIVDPANYAYYSNLTGFVHAKTRFHNITPSALAESDTLTWRPLAEAFIADTNMTGLEDRLGSWNWTACNKLAFSVVAKNPPTTAASQIALVHGKIELTDAWTLDDFRLEFEGVHFLANGTIYGFAAPGGGHIDIRLLPSLVPESARNETAPIIEPELKARINKLKNLIDAGVVEQESSSDESPKSACSFTFHGQINPVAVPEQLMKELEEEIQKPTGISTVIPPKLSVNGVLVSKECGLLYAITDSEGLSSSAFFRKVITYAGLSGLVYLAILVLFARQAERSRTPSGISRVSRWTFLAQSTMDSVSFAGHITFAILAEGRPSLTLIAPAFLACALFVQEAQFFTLVNSIQGPENFSPPSQPAPTALSTAPSVDAAPLLTATPNPLPQSPATTQSSFFAFFIHHARTDPQARLYITLFIFLTLIVRVILSPTLSMIFVAVTYSSIWLPQIIRTARRGRPSGLAKEYIIGTTICRLFNALYFLACPRNVLEVEPRSWSYILAVFVVLQALVLMLQDVFGPSFFLPHRFTVAQLYDYHPPMPLPDFESPEQSLGDCAICMEDIIITSPLRRRSKSLDARGDWEEKGSTAAGRKGKGGLLNAMHMGVGGVTARKSYSLAPCHHLFHTDCLEKWLAIKNICPQCRRPLPPL